MTNTKLIFVFSLLALISLVGCLKDNESDQSKEIPASTTEQIGLHPASTNTPEPPTQTPISLAPTFTPVPTITPAPTATSNPVRNISLRTSRDFGDNRNPFTGEEVSDPANLSRRPIAVKISNSPPRWVRPQSGLNEADLVFEHVTEGLITRFTAIIYATTPEKLGPIRSARLIDLDIPVMYDAALAYSGSSIGVSRRLFASDFRSRILRSNSQGYYRTGENKPYEHTLYAEPEGLWQALTDRSENHEPDLQNIMTFSTVPPNGGEQASAITVNYRDWTVIEWRYDAESGKYKRWVEGEKHTDANTDRQIDSANVIVIFTDDTLDRSICETQSGSSCLAYSRVIDLMGTGQGILFRDGRQYAITWRRDIATDLLTFENHSGNPVPLQIGNSWIQVIPNSYPEPVSIDP
jgi:hypothetical protein